MLGTSFDEFAELAFQAQPGAQGVTLVPFFDGERTPNRPTASARLEGMNLAKFIPCEAFARHCTQASASEHRYSCA